MYLTCLAPFSDMKNSLTSISKETCPKQRPGSTGVLNTLVLIIQCDEENDSEMEPIYVVYVCMLRFSVWSFERKTYT